MDVTIEFLMKNNAGVDPNKVKGLEAWMASNGTCVVKISLGGKTMWVTCRLQSKGRGLGVALAAPRPKYELVEQMVGRHGKPWAILIIRGLPLETMGNHETP